MGVTQKYELRVSFKEQLKQKEIITTYFSECILCKILTGNKVGYIGIVSPVKELVNLIVVRKILINLCTRLNTLGHPL